MQKWKGIKQSSQWSSTEGTKENDEKVNKPIAMQVNKYYSHVTTLVGAAQAESKMKWGNVIR